MRALALLLLTTACIEGEGTNPFGAGLLQDKPSMTNGGEAWPARAEDDWQAPTPLRTFYVAPGGDDEAPGNADEPWGDLQTALCRLRSGDRLVLRAGEYKGPIAIDGDCVSADGRGPIEVVGEPGANIVSGPAPVSDGLGFWNPILLLNRGGWQLRNLVIDGADYGGIGLQVLERGSRSELRDIVIKEASYASLSVGPNVRELEATNIVMRHGQYVDGNVTHGLLLLGGCAAITLRNSFIHHNSGDGVQIWGPHVLPVDLGTVPNVIASRNLLFEGNEIHDNQGHGIVVGSSAEVTIKRNRLWNGRPSPVGEGRAIEIHDLVVGVSVEENLIVESTEGIAVGAGERPEAHPDGPRPPQDVWIARNYISNPLQPGRYGILVDTATDVRIYHNAIETVRKGLFIKDLPPKTQGLRILNNLILEASEVGFRVSGMAAVDRFDFNAFSLGATDVLGEINGERSTIASLVENGEMPNTQAVNQVSIGVDLRSVEGVEVVDRGTPIPGLNYEGAAPDLGPAEQ